MLAALTFTGTEDYAISARAVLQSLKPIPKIEDLDDDAHIFRLLDPTCHYPVPIQLPERRHTFPDVKPMVVSTSLIRRIELELKHDNCDPRTVFNSCRGLARGSMEFENAYIAARIHSFARHQRLASVPLPSSQPDADPLFNPVRTNMKQNLPPPPHPMAVCHLGHLMSHLGIWVICLLGIQAWAAWSISAVANAYLEGGRPFYFGIGLFLMSALDSVIWFRRRGRLCDAFLLPGTVLLLMALLPIFIIHVRGVLQAMH